jgi:hypothetical protein
MTDVNPYLQRDKWKDNIPSSVLVRFDPIGWHRKEVRERDKIPEWKYGQSSPKDFENRFGLDGFSFDYALPYGMSPVQFEMYMDAEMSPPASIINRTKNNGLYSNLKSCKDFASRHSEYYRTKQQEFISNLAHLNPELELIPFKDLSIWKANQMLAGIAYRFHPLDIKFFICDEVTPATKERATNLSKEFEKITSLTGEHSSLGWSPSPPQMDRMQLFLDNYDRSNVDTMQNSLKKPKIKI